MTTVLIPVKTGDNTTMPCSQIDQELSDGIVKSKDGWTCVKASKEQNGILVILDDNAVMTKGIFISQEQLKCIGYVKSRKRQKNKA